MSGRQTQIAECSDCRQPGLMGGRGRCQTCYMRYYRSREFIPFKDLPLAEKIRLKSERAESGCLEWVGARNPSGYGVVCHDGVHYLAHRASYTESVGPIPDELTIDHLCRNKRCIEPTHLEAVTQAENNRRRGYVRPTHCKRGHAYAEHGAPRPGASGGPGRLICATCTRERQRRHQSRSMA